MQRGQEVAGSSQRIQRTKTKNNRIESSRETPGTRPIKQNA